MKGQTRTPRLPPLLRGLTSLEHVRTQPLRFLLEAMREHGDIFRYEVEGWSSVVVNNPVYVQHVLQGNPRNYTKQGTPDLMMLRPVLGEGLMTSEGTAWAEQRAVARPAFERSRIETFVRLMTGATEEMLEGWEHRVGTDQPVDLEQALSHLTLRIVVRCLFGCDIGDASLDFGKAVQVLNEHMARFDPWDTAGLLRFQEAKRALETIVQRIITQRREEGGDREDLLSMLMDSHAGGLEGPQDDQQLRDQIFTFLMAGHETTAKSLTWTLYLLDEHPEARTRVREEILGVLGHQAPTAHDLRALEGVWRAIQESIRLYPPVWLMSRMCQQEDVICGNLIPAGSLVLVSPYLLHRHPAFWNAPQTFDPDRFLPQPSLQRHSYTYFPFGGGPRVCIGRNFAMIEARLVLALILRRFHLQRVPGHPVEPEALVTLRPRHGLPMRVNAWERS